MTNKSKGYIPLWRGIQDHWLWQSSEPFDERSAWIDLLLSVNHEEKKIKVDGRVQVIKVGQMWTSYKKLSNRWNWSRERVYRYTKMLKNDGMIYVDATPRGTLLTVINYEFYRLQKNTHETANKTTNEATPKTANETSHETQTITNKNVNNEKKVNKKDPTICPGEGWTWSDERQRWIAPPKGGGSWQ